MLLQNCKLKREAALHDRIILYSECTEQGKKFPHPFLPKEPSLLTRYNSLQPAHRLAAEQYRPNARQTNLTCTAKIHLLKFPPPNFFSIVTIPSSFPKVNIVLTTLHKKKTQTSTLVHLKV